MTVLEVFGDVPVAAWEAWAGLFFVVLVGKFSRTESRLVMASIAGLIAYPHAATLFVVGMLGLLFAAFDFVNVGQKG